MDFSFKVQLSSMLSSLSNNWQQNGLLSIDLEGVVDYSICASVK